MPGPMDTAMQRRTSQFDVARKKADQAETANLQTARDAIARRTAMGGSGFHGVGIKAEQDAVDQSARRRADANEAINAAESADLERKAEVEAGRKFAREERLGSQEFSSGESALQRRFATQERLGGQEFAGEQARLGREFQHGERLGSQEFATGERLSGQEFAAGEAGKQRDFAANEAQLQRDASRNLRDYEISVQREQFGQQLGLSREQFDHEIKVDDFNMTLARDMFEEKDMLESLFGNFSMGNIKKGGKWAGGGVSDWWHDSALPSFQGVGI